MKTFFCPKPFLTFLLITIVSASTNAGCLDALKSGNLSGNESLSEDTQKELIRKFYLDDWWPYFKPAPKVYAAQVAPDGKTISIAFKDQRSEDRIQIWDLTKMKLLFDNKIHAHLSSLEQSLLAPDGKTWYFKLKHSFVSYNLDLEFPSSPSLRESLITTHSGDEGERVSNFLGFLPDTNKLVIQYKTEAPSELHATTPKEPAKKLWRISIIDKDQPSVFLENPADRFFYSDKYRVALLVSGKESFLWDVPMSRAYILNPIAKLPEFIYEKTKIDVRYGEFWLNGSIRIDVQSSRPKFNFAATLARKFTPESVAQRGGKPIQVRLWVKQTLGKELFDFVQKLSKEVLPLHPEAQRVDELFRELLSRFPTLFTNLNIEKQKPGILLDQFVTQEGNNSFVLSINAPMFKILRSEPFKKHIIRMTESSNP